MQSTLYIRRYGHEALALCNHDNTCVRVIHPWVHDWRWISPRCLLLLFRLCIHHCRYVCLCWLDLIHLSRATVATPMSHYHNLICTACYSNRVEPNRAKLGYRTCLTCGEQAAKQVKHTVVPMPKSNYIAVTDLSLLKGLNSSHKGGSLWRNTSSTPSA